MQSSDERVYKLVSVLAEV
jgi:hypothetical protein